MIHVQMGKVAGLSLDICISFHKYYVCIDSIKLTNIKEKLIPLNKSLTQTCIAVLCTAR